MRLITFLIQNRTGEPVGLVSLSDPQLAYEAALRMVRKLHADAGIEFVPDQEDPAFFFQPIRGLEFEAWTTLAGYTSPDRPEGWFSVWGFLAQRHPEILFGLGDDPESLIKDEAWLDRRMEALARSIRWLEAPPAIRARGINRVKAYPVDLLEERFAE